jgi:hypothetical protein
MLQYVQMACVQIRTHKHKAVQHRCNTDSLFGTATGEQNVRTGNSNLTSGDSCTFPSAQCPHRDTGIAQSVYGPGYGLHDPGFVTGRVHRRLFSSSNCSDRLRGPSDLPFNGSQGSFPGVKLPGRDFDHSPSFCAEVKNKWRYTSALLIRLHGFERENFTSYLLQNRVWDPPRLLPIGYNEPRVLYPGIKCLENAVNLMQKVNEEWGNTCIPIYVISGAMST